MKKCLPPLLIPAAIEDAIQPTLCSPPLLLLHEPRCTRLNLPGAVTAHQNHYATTLRRRVLLQYACEWCHRIKRHGDGWILGFAAEHVGATSASRELIIAAEWSERWAAHPLAVHFCSEKHKQQFVRALFHTQPAARSPRRRRAVSLVRDGVSSAASVGSAQIEVADRTPARRRATERGSRKRVSRRAAIFAAPDSVRAHGLSVRLDDSTLEAH
jgi:hypothetical protein